MVNKLARGGKNAVIRWYDRWHSQYISVAVPSFFPLADYYALDGSHFNNRCLMLSACPSIYSILAVTPCLSQRKHMSKRYEAITFLRRVDKYSVVLLWRVLGVSTSGYYAYLKREKRPISDEEKKLLTRIKRIHTINCGTYGAKRIAKELKARGTIVNHKKVARIMREANIKSKIRIKRNTKESKSLSAGYVYENLLDRDFDADHPNQKWVTDMTELTVENQKIYISALIDLFNREIIAFEVSDSPNLQLIKDTVEAAQRHRKLENLDGVLIHSDQGSVYRSHMYHYLSKSLGFTPSM